MKSLRGLTMENIVHEILPGVGSVDSTDGMDPPTTKFPDLDIYDHGLDGRLHLAGDGSHSLTVRCTSKDPHDSSIEIYEKTILKHLERFAQFIFGLTGQDSISICCDVTLALRSWHGIIVAVPPTSLDERCHLRRISSEETTVPISDFFYSFDFMNHYEKEPVHFSFPDTFSDNVKLEVTLPTSSLPVASIQHLKTQIERFFNPRSDTSGNTLDKGISILPQSYYQNRSEILSPPEEDNLHKLFEVQAERYPERCAIEFFEPEALGESGSRRVLTTYGQLDEKAEMIAGRLREILGEQSSREMQNSVVPVFMSTTPELYIAYLAILKAGCAFCPLPADAPSQRLRDIIKEIDPSVVLGIGSARENGSWHEVFPASSIIWVDVLSCPQRSQSSHSDQVAADSLAYVMFTSGSSGRPKGVRVTHRAASSSIRAHMEQYDRTMPRNVPLRWFQLAAPTFDPSIMEIFVTLSKGGTLCAAPRDIALSAPEVALTETRATITMATPGIAATFDLNRLPTIQCLWTMGETLFSQVTTTFGQSDLGSTRIAPGELIFRPRICLCNAYGPTEAAINVTFFPNVPWSMRGSIIGYPLGTSGLLVIDPKAPGIRPVPLGFAGELAITGVQLALGYNKDSAETSSAFIYDEYYGRVYRTGDRGRVVWDSDDVPLLEYLGRVNRGQVKINGQRVELGEIESVLCSLPTIRSAVALVHQLPYSSKLRIQLVVCLVPELAMISSFQIVEEQCRELAVLRLPAYMRPMKYLQLPRLPRTAAGKLDRQKVSVVALGLLLNKSEVQQGTMDRNLDTSVPSAGDKLYDISKMLREALFETTGVSKLISDSLHYEIDSLSAMRFLRNAREKGLERMSLRDVLEAQSLNSLAKLIIQRSTKHQVAVDAGREQASIQLKILLQSFRTRWQSRIQEYFKLTEHDIQNILPITETQSRILLGFSNSRVESVRLPKYVHHSLHTFNHDIDSHKLKIVWQHLVQKHDVYRTVFMPVDDEMSPFAQAVVRPTHPMAQAKWYERSFDDVGDGIHSKAISAARKAENLISLDTPMPVLTLLKTTDGTSILLSLMHAIFDLRSLNLLITDIMTLMNGKKVGHREESATAVNACFLTQSAGIDSFWNDYLSHQESSPFPSLTSIRSDSTHGIFSKYEVTSRLTMAEFETRSRNLLCSPLSGLQAAWSAILLAYTSFGVADVAFGSLLADRVAEDRSVCIAPMFTIVPTRVRSNESSLNIDIMRVLTNDNSQAVQHIHSSIRSKRTQSRLYDTTIALQVFQDSDDLKDIRCDTMILPMAHDYAVMIEATPDANGTLCYKAVYSNVFLDQNSAQLMLSQLDEILIWMLANPMLPFFEALSCLDTGKLSTLNRQPQTKFTTDHCLLHSVFESNAQALPNQPALEFYYSLIDAPGSAMFYTYSELNAEANRMARMIIAQYGNMQSLTIPIMMEKRPELYLAILAVLKSGASWCSIDTGSPSKRRKDLINRIKPKLLLVSPDASIEMAGVPEGVEVMPISFQGELNSIDYHDGPEKLNLQSSESLAYVIWTSGTTGPPKGVEVSHKAICTSIDALRTRVPYRTHSKAPPRCVQLAQDTFDVFVQDLFCTWNEGGTLISAPKELMIGSFPSICCKSKATHAHMTPSFATTVSRDSCPSLEGVTMIGEKLPQYVADDWGRNIKAFNTYGPAEAAVVATVNEFSGERKCIKSSNIGLPLASVSCYIMRNERILMSQGVGELALGGPQLAEGYLKDAEKTSTKFIKDAASQSKLYLTGDMVRKLADGTLDFVGREDDLVKLGGIRVELSEISHAMVDCHEQVVQVETLYLSRTDRPSKYLVTFIMTDAKSDVDQPAFDGQVKALFTPESAEIARLAMLRARQSLPAFMVPGIIIVTRKFPKTSSGKVDRNVLKTVYELLDLRLWESHVWGDRLEPHWKSDAIASKLRRCLSQFSDAPIETIHAQSSLHSLGIDSLSVLRFVQRLKSCGIVITAAELLRCETVFHAIQVLQQNKPNHVNQIKQRAAMEEFNNTWLPRVEVGLNRNASFVMPATPLQEGLLSESLLEASSYWSNHFFELMPSVTIPRLKIAWNLIVKTTEALRTSFVSPSEVAHDGDSPPCKSSFLMLVVKDVVIDWDELDASNGVEKVAKQKANVVALKHQKSFFRQPPWALTILGNGPTRTMMITIHHSLHDDDSIKFLMKNLAATYCERQLSRQHQITDALSPSVRSEDQVEDETYWRETLQKFADISLSPWPNLSGIERPVQRMNSRKMISAKVDLDMTWGELTEATRRIQASLSVVLKVAFGSLLLDFLESSKVVFGEVISERYAVAEYRDVIAPLVTVKPVPFMFEDTVTNLLSEQSNLNAQSRSHQALPGPQTRKILLRPTGETLYPAIFAFHPPVEDYIEDDTPSTELWRRSNDMIGLSVEHDFAFNAFTAQDGLTIETTAKESLSNQDSLVLYCNQIKSRIQTILRDPARPLLELSSGVDSSLVSRSESTLEKAEDSMSHTKSTYWLQYYAKHQPNWIAVEVASMVSHGKFETVKWNFDTLYKNSCKIARFLRNQTFKGSIIALCSRRTLQSYAVIVGIFMSGKTYLPIDDTLPHQRKLLLIEDSGCSLLLTDSQCVEGFDIMPLDCPIWNIDKLHQNEEFQQTSELPTPDPNCDQTAYLIYTSGSTGKPKGVCMSHRSLCGFVGGLTGVMNHSSGLAGSQGGIGKWLGLASRAFDVHLGEMFLAWRSGLAAVTAPRETILDDLRFALVELQVTHACFVPSLLEQAELEPDQIPNFVFMTIGGEKLSKRIIDTWTDHSRITAVNAYGPTELAIGCTAAHLTPKLSPGNIGFPYGDTVAHILLPTTDHYAWKGQTGELCFTGCLVGNGYHNRPEAKGFVENFHGQRMYRTGDMARMHTDGSLTYLGRSDDQTKLRGQRIELSEISESIRISNATAVEVATLLLHHPKLSSTFLVTFISEIVAREKRYDARPELVGGKLQQLATRSKQHCAQTLPRFMNPDYIVPINIIPLARTSGKAETKTLKAFFASLSVSKLLGTLGKDIIETVQEKRQLSPQESKIASIVKSTLELPHESVLDPEENLFSLGLDSLNAVGLILRLREIGFKCPFSLLLGQPTVNAIGAGGEWDLSPLPVIKALETMNEYNLPLEHIIEQNESQIDINAVEKILPCLPIQESTVTATLTNQSSYPYINHVVTELDQSVDLARFKQSWYKLIEARPVLRSFLVNCHEYFVQVVLRPEADKISWRHIDCGRKCSMSNVFSGIVKSTSEGILNEIQMRPPLRLHLVEAENAPASFIVSIHHALYDAHSFSMMIEDVWHFYNVQSLPPRSTIETMLEYRASQDPVRQRLYWENYLKDYHPVQTSDHDATAQNYSSSAQVDDTLQLNLVIVRDLAKKLGVALSTLMQYLFSVTLARKSGRPDILFGVILSGRAVPIIDADLIAAPCITTIPHRLRILPNDTLLESLRQSQTASAMSLEHQHTSLRDIARWTQFRLPMFDALFSFNYANEHEQAKTLFTPVSESMELGYPLAVEVLANQKSNTLDISCVCADVVGAKGRATSIIEDMKILLAMLQNGEDPKILGLGNFKQRSSPTYEVKQWDEKNWSEVESKIRDTVQVFKGIDSRLISKNVSFFQLGIDSVSAIRLAQSLKRTDVLVNPADIMRCANVGSLAHYVTSRSEASLQEAIVARPASKVDLWDIVADQKHLPRGSIEAVYDCTPLQAGMITSTLGSGGNAYVHQHVRLLPPNVDCNGLSEAWGVTVRSLDILRTSFFFNVGQQNWIACVHQYVEKNDMNIVELFDQDETHAGFHLLVEEDFKKPLVRATLVRHGDQMAFHLTLHHALYDGHSLPKIFDVLSRAYQGLPMDMSHFPPFHEIADKINTRVSQSLTFWQDKLSNYRGGSNHQSESSTNYMSASRNWSISPMEASRMCEVMGVTLQSVLLTTWAKVLAMISNTRDVVFGHVVSGRYIPGIDCENVIGPMFNTVPFRVSFDNLFASNEDAVKQVLNFTTEAYAYQHASLATIQREWRKTSRRSGIRLFDSIFLFQNNSSALEDEFWRPVEIDHQEGPSEYYLNIEVEQTRSQLILTASCHEGCLVKGSLTDLLEDYEKAFQNILNFPKHKVGSHPPGLSSVPFSKTASKSVPSLAINDNLDDRIVQKLKGVLAQMTGLPLKEIANSSSIFLLGLTSLSAITIAGRCRKEGLNASVADVLQGVTVEGICSRIAKKTEPKSSVRKTFSHIKFQDLLKPPVSEQFVEAFHPALSGQTYHLASWLGSGRTLYMPTFSFSCTKLDIGRFHNAWSALRRRHPILRSTFAALNETDVAQIVLPVNSTTDESLTYGPGAVHLQSIRDYVRAEQRQAVDLRIPPVRVQIVQGLSHDVVMLTIHHALYDAWSLPILLSDLAHLYNGRDIEPPADWQGFVNHRELSERSATESDFWKKALGTFSKTILTGSSNDEADHDPNQSFVSFPNVLTNVTSLSVTCQRYNVSLPTVLLLSFARSLAAITNVKNPVFGLFALGRSSSFPDMSRIAGPCLNMLPVVVSSPWDEPWHVKAQEIQKHLGERVPYEQSALPFVLQCVQESCEEPFEFNTFVNILWSEAPLVEGVKHDEDDNFFKPLNIGVPSDFVPQEKFKVEGILEDLKWPVSNDGLYIDIALSQDCQNVSINARSQGGACGRQKIETLLLRFKSMAREILQLV